MSLQMREVRLRDLVEMLAVYEPMAVRAIAARRDQAALGELAQCVAAQQFCGDDYAPDGTPAADGEAPPKRSPPLP